MTRAFHIHIPWPQQHPCALAPLGLPVVNVRQFRGEYGRVRDWKAENIPCKNAFAAVATVHFARQRE